jgi:hypothetical protein
VGGTNISVDNTDPLNPVISAPGSDVPGAPMKTNPIVWGDLAVITDSEDGNTLKRATFLNIRNVLKTYFDTVYTALGNWLPLSGGTLSGELISTASNSYRLANGSGKSLILRKDATNFYALISDTPTGDFNTLRPFRIDLASGKVFVGNGFRSEANIEAGSAVLETNGNVWGSIWNNGSLSAWLSSTSNRAYPRRSDGGAMNFNWSGQSGQPTWLWGGTDGTNMYVYNPVNFSVNYANSAGNAATLGGADRGYLEGVSYNYGYSRTRDYLLAENIPVGGYVFAQCNAGGSGGPGSVVGGGNLYYAHGNGSPMTGAINVGYGTWWSSGTFSAASGANQPTAATLWKRIG